MSYFMCLLLSGAMGVAAHHYVAQFAKRLMQAVYDCYCEIFPKNAPHFMPQYSSLKPIKCGSIWFSFFGGSFLFCGNAFIYEEPIFAMIISIVLIILIVISIIDWYYKLISPVLCQLLLCIGIGLAYFHYTSISLEQSLLSAAIGFSTFWGIFYFAAWYYQKEAFGRGDYWLIAALSSFLPWQFLPLFIFLSCLCAIVYAFIRRAKMIPFAPFLNLGAILAFVLG